MFLPWLKNLSPFSKISLFTLLFLTVSIFAAVSLSLTQKTLTSGAWYTAQGVSVSCQNNKVKIKITFTNRESAGTKSMNVIATDITTGQKTDMGAINGGETKTVDMETPLSEVAGGTIMYSLTWTSGARGVDSRSAQYASVKCGSILPSPTLNLPSPTTLPSPTNTPTAQPTSIPTVQPTNTPSPTDQPGSTVFNFNLLLHGIGNGGDNANLASKGNFDLDNDKTKIAIEIFDTKNNPVLNKSGELLFSSESGSFKGAVDLGTGLASGAYLIKVKADKYLRSSVPGLVNIKSGSVNNIPKLSLVAGDINNDNLLNILDYNALSACYGENTNPQNCAMASDADINRDSAVNLFDFNLFLRELSTNPGE